MWPQTNPPKKREIGKHREMEGGEERSQEKGEAEEGRRKEKYLWEISESTS